MFHQTNINLRTTVGTDTSSSTFSPYVKIAARESTYSRGRLNQIINTAKSHSGVGVSGISSFQFQDMQVVMNCIEIKISGNMPDLISCLNTLNLRNEVAAINSLATSYNQTWNGKSYGQVYNTATFGAL